MKWYQTDDERNSCYDHVICDTPIGKIRISWKGWKQCSSYWVEILDEDFLAKKINRGDYNPYFLGYLLYAKRNVKKFLTDLHKELGDFLNENKEEEDSHFDKYPDGEWDVILNAENTIQCKYCRLLYPREEEEHKIFFPKYKVNGYCSEKCVNEYKNIMLLCLFMQDLVTAAFILLLLEA